MAKAPKRRGRPPDPETRARRREEILEAAAMVFAARGFDAAEVQEVADRGGVGKATVYRHFPAKEDLFLAALDRRILDLHRSVEGAREGAADGLDAMARGIRAYLAWFDAHPEVVELLVQERATFRDRRKPTYFRYREECAGPWRGVLEELARAGVVRRVPAERIVEVVGDALYGTIFTNHFAGRRRSFDDQARDLVDVLFRGILAPVPPRPARGARARPRPPGGGAAATPTVHPKGGRP